jgi:hypothetical protein
MARAPSFDLREHVVAAVAAADTDRNYPLLLDLHVTGFGIEIVCVVVAGTHRLASFQDMQKQDLLFGRHVRDVSLVVFR